MAEVLDFLCREDVKKFISEHISTDVRALLLNPPKELANHIKEIADQLISRQKAKGKLDEWATNFDLIMPPPISIEQASSQATCAYKRQLISGEHLIDLTGGMGIDCLSLSEKFIKTTYVEQQHALCKLFTHNTHVLKKDIEIVHAEAETFLSNSVERPEVSVIYLDPARRDGFQNKVFKIADCSPDVISLLPLLKSHAQKVLVKFSPMLDLHAIQSTFTHLQEIHVVSVKNECKEILLLINFDFEGEHTIKAVNLQTDQASYSFKKPEESSSTAHFGTLASYCFEPNSSIMKAGAFKKIGEDFGLAKLAEHTHFYTSDTVCTDFPGRVFRILSGADKRTLKQYAPNGKINVIARNHPMSATALKKKWKLKDGGDYFLIAFRDGANKSNMVIAEKLKG